MSNSNVFRSLAAMYAAAALAMSGIKPEPRIDPPKRFLSKNQAKAQRRKEQRKK